MRPTPGTFLLDQAGGAPVPRLRGYLRTREAVPELGAYGLLVVSLEQRKQAFSRFVKVAMADARARGLTVAEVESRTGITSTTIYRWRDGVWSKDPRPSQVRAFCVGLGIPWQSAFKVLGWTTDDEQVSAPDPVLPPEITAILRTLNDPNTAESEKQTIRAMLDMIARQHGRQRRRSAG